MNRDMIHEPLQASIPMALSLRRNADLEEGCEQLVAPDRDE
jgi:hypothetical protein